ncbi:MAG TPA: hypothetical protein VF655_07650 [Allosphingosinicella sp.]
MPAGGEADQLQTAAEERPGDVAADLVIAPVLLLTQPVVALNAADGKDVFV